MNTKKSNNEKNAIRFRIQFDLEYNPDQGKITGPGNTVPDMNLTVRQLLENHTRGAQGAPEKKPFYFERQIPTIQDLTDVQRYREHLELELKNTAEFVQRELDEQKAQKAAEAKASAKAELLKELEKEKKATSEKQ